MYRLALVWGAALVVACHAVLPLEGQDNKQSDSTSPPPDSIGVDSVSGGDGPLDGANECDGSVNLQTDPWNCGTCGNECPPAKDPCRRPACAAGKCTVEDVPEGDVCSFESKTGKCHRKECCTGCWDGSMLECRSGSTGGHCGAHGGPCKVCEGQSPCSSDSCTSDGKCLATHKPDKTGCLDGGEQGLCHLGKCCTGCWDALKSACAPGSHPTACGVKGADCSYCVKSADGCASYTCTSSGACITDIAVDGTACPGGTCYQAKCCKGCWDGTNCLTGTHTAWCGSGGASCKPCAGTSCTLPDCSTGTCAQQKKADGTACSSGVCVDGICCNGCVDGATGKCLKGDQLSACGQDGVTCVVCPASSNQCQNPVCDADGACGFTTVADGVTCFLPLGGTGACWNGDCCDGCWDAANTKCVPSSFSSTEELSCGSQGALCKPCDTCGQSCLNGLCTPTSDQPNGTPCTDETGQAGICEQGDCCTGCVDPQSMASNKCVPGNSTANCGTGGVQCKPCKSGKLCINGICI